MKLCVDCKYYNKTAYETECLNPKNISIPERQSAVTGMVHPPKYRESPYSLRATGVIFTRLWRYCGKEGRWYERAAKPE